MRPALAKLDYFSLPDQPPAGLHGVKKVDLPRLHGGQVRRLNRTNATFINMSGLSADKSAG
jgi:hypothetical protein